MDDYFWLSFAGDDQPARVAIIRAENMLAAVNRAWRVGCNPGGEVCGVPFNMAEAPDEVKSLPLHTLLTTEQLKEAGVPIKEHTPEELEEAGVPTIGFNEDEEPK